MKNIILLCSALAMFALTAHADKPSYSPLDFDIALETCLETTRAGITETEPETYEIGVTAEALYTDCTHAMTDRLALLDTAAVQGIGIPVDALYTEAWRRANAVIERANAEKEIINMIGPEFWDELTTEVCTAEAEADAEESGSDRGYHAAMETCMARELAGRWISLTEDSFGLCMTADGYACAARTLPEVMEGRFEDTEAGEISFYKNDSETPMRLRLSPDSDVHYAPDETLRLFVEPGDAPQLLLEWLPIWEPGLIEVNGITVNSGERAALKTAEGNLIIVHNRVVWKADDLGRDMKMFGAYFTPKGGEPEFAAHYKRFTD